MAAGFPTSTEMRVTDDQMVMLAICGASIEDISRICQDKMPFLRDRRYRCRRKVNTVLDSTAMSRQ